MPKLIARPNPETLRIIDDMRSVMSIEAGKKIPYGNILTNVAESLVPEARSVD